MKKAYSFIALVTVMTLCLTGCAITANRPAAVTSSPSQTNTSAEAVVSPSAEVSADISSADNIFASGTPAPTVTDSILEHWTQTIDDGGYGNIEIDTDVKIPEEASYPDTALEPAALTRETVDKMEEYFGGYKKLYKWPAKDNSPRDGYVDVNDGSEEEEYPLAFFYYQLCEGYCTESEYKNDLRGMNDESGRDTSGYGAILDGLKLEEPEAQAQADKVLSGLGINNMALVSSEKAVLESFSPDVDVHSAHNSLPNILPDRGGYVFTYTRNYNGIKGSEFISDNKGPNDIPDYALLPDPETITIAISQNGLEYFGWNNIMRFKQDAGNTKILDFSQIKQPLIDVIKHEKENYGANRYGDENNTVKVISADLRIACIVTDTKEIKAVPAWVFTAEVTDMKGCLLKTDVFIINAADGGVMMYEHNFNI